MKKEYHLFLSLSLSLFLFLFLFLYPFPFPFLYPFPFLFLFLFYSYIHSYYIIHRKDQHEPEGELGEHSDNPSATSTTATTTVPEYGSNGVLQDMSVTLESSRMCISNEIDLLTEMVKEREMELLRANKRQAEMEKMQETLEEMSQRLKAMESVWNRLNFEYLLNLWLFIYLMIRKNNN